MKKRDRLEIIHDILLTIRDRQGKVKPTTILYKSNLSYQMLNEYLGELLEKEFITEHIDKSEKKSYELNDKGYQYIADYKMVRQFIDSYGLE